MTAEEIESLAMFIAKKMQDECIISDTAPIEETILPSVREWLEEFFV